MSAVETDIQWEPIIAIEAVGREAVFDIEVEGTHNFVANGIVAHNSTLEGGGEVSTAAPAPPDDATRASPPGETVPSGGVKGHHRSSRSQLSAGISTEF